MGNAPTELPSGIVTFVFTDIEGSTRLLRRLGDAYAPVLDRHQDIIRSNFTACRGREVHVEGDGFLFAFDDAGAAVEACRSAQRALHTEPWPSDGLVRVRMGIHCGLASPRRG